MNLAAGLPYRVVDHPGATFTGLVNGGDTIGGSAVSTPQLASGRAQGVVSGIGAQFVNVTSVVVDAGADWSLTGQNSLAAGVALLDRGHFAAGTRIATKHRLVAVEDLAVGDRVVTVETTATASGLARSVRARRDRICICRRITRCSSPAGWCR